ncbi:MAG TPA: hypothetical protein VG960_11595 [Caulobacteraceae bacterium]|nr:hypothetical protein [Caulobacteraceae bacterium]
MAQIDPLKLMRNRATLEAYRRHQGEVWAAAQPWLTFALIGASVEIGLFLYGLSHPRIFHDFSLLSSLLVFVSGCSFGIASLRAWLFRRAHPFELPGTPSANRWDREVR